MTLDVTGREPIAVSHTHYCVVGDVTVDDSAAIAPGVVLQALPGSRIVIGKGACLAGGVCVQSKSGVLAIASGATLGANVLVVGSGSIGSNACISPGSTLMNPQIADNALLPPNTLSEKKVTGSSHSRSARNNFSQNGFSQDDFSQNGFNQSGTSQNNVAHQPLPKNTFVEPGPIAAKPVQIPSIDNSAPAASYDPSKNGVQLNQTYDLSNGNSSSSALTAPNHDRVYGRDQVSELLSTLFPHRQSLNGTQDN